MSRASTPRPAFILPAVRPDKLNNWRDPRSRVASPYNLTAASFTPPSPGVDVSHVITTLTRSLVALAFISAAILSATNSRAAFTTPSRTGASSGAPVDVDDALKITSHDAVLDKAIGKMETLAALLARATDERSAREVCPAAERCFIELQLIMIRATMLPPTSVGERARLQSHQAGFTAARAALDKETARLAATPALTAHLRSVMWPMREQIKHVQKQEGISLASQLQTLRSQIELYKLQHRDAPPDFKRHGWNQLTSKTAADGSMGPRGEFGPYLQSVPRNPVNNNTRLLIVRGNPGRDFRYDKNDAGFVYDEISGRLWALDADGRIFNEAGGAQASVGD